ncbi:MAG: alpha/beta fold hydrolase [Anaerolineales bacterium]
MKHKFRGFKRSAIQVDFNLYRVNVPIRGVSDSFLSIIDLWPEGVERTIVFVHGYAGVAETWEHQLNYFSRDYRVIAPDLRGHGQSDAPYTRYTMPELVDDILNIADTLNLPERFTLAGHSFGGSICVEFAKAHPERLEKLILVATAGEYPLPRATSLLSRVPTAAMIPFWRYRPRWNAEVHVMKSMLLNNMKQWNGWEMLREITTPTMLITGERDRYFPRRVFEGVGEAIPGAEIVDVGASKHKVQLERHAAVNRAIGRFVGEGERRFTWRDQAAKSGSVADRPWLMSYDGHVPHTIPIPRQPLHRFLETTADWMPNRTATLFYGSHLTYKQLNRRVNQFAHTLHGLGVSPGDRVMIVLPNMPQMIIAYYAALKIGAVVVLANPEANAQQIAAQLQRAEAKVLVTLTDFAELAQAAGDRLTVVLTDIRQAVSRRVYQQLMARWQTAGLGQDGADTSAALNMEELMMDASREAPDVEVTGDDLAVILFTSGTTDEPKGVQLSHANLVANALQLRHWVPDMATGRETFLCVLPFSHSYAMTAAMNLPIAIGATMVLLPVFELQQVLDHIKEHKPTLFPGVPTIYMALNNAPNVRSYGLGAIRFCISGAAPLPVEVQEKFEKLTRGRLVEGYGLTEASPATHSNPFGATGKEGSIGVPLPNTEAKVVDLMSGEDLPAGSVGELVVKGPQVMQGYLGGDEGGESVLRDGWLHTGDVAVMDADGFFTIISRVRDTIMAGEYSVYPRDVEEVLYENGKVMEVAVVGVTAEDGDQRVKAFVVPRPGSDLTENELLEMCRRRLEPYAVPWEIEFRQDLPKSFVGKVLRRMLVENRA